MGHNDQVIIIYSEGLDGGGRGSPTLLGVSQFKRMNTPPSSPWLEDSFDGNPFDREPSEWFPDQDKRYETPEMVWDDEDSVKDEDPESDCESVNSIPMSLGSFSTQSSTYEEDECLTN